MKQTIFKKEELFEFCAKMANIVMFLHVEDDIIYRKWAILGVSEKEYTPDYEKELKRLYKMLMSTKGNSIIRLFMSMLYGRPEGNEIFVPNEYEYPIRYLLSARGDLLRIYDSLTDDVFAGKVAYKNEIIKVIMERHAKFHRNDNHFPFSFDLERFNRVNSMFRRVNPHHKISEEEALQKYYTTTDREANEIVCRLFSGYNIHAFPDEPPLDGVSKYKRVFCKAQKRRGKIASIRLDCACCDKEGNHYHMKDEKSDCVCIPPFFGNINPNYKPPKAPCDNEEFDDTIAVAALLREWDSGMWRLEVIKADEDGYIRPNRTGEYKY